MRIKVIKEKINKKQFEEIAQQGYGSTVKAKIKKNSWQTCCLI